MNLNRLRRVSIGTKVSLWCGVWFVVTAVLVSFHTADVWRDGATESALANSKLELRRLTEQAKRRVDDVRRTAATIAYALGASSDSEAALHLRRPELSALLRAMLEADPGLVGVFAAWEEGALDDEDGAPPLESGHGPAGRFMPYWHRTDKGRIWLGTLLEHRGGVLGEYYDTLRRHDGDILGGPFSRVVSGRSTEFVTVIVPIRSADEFYGVVGCDLALSFLYDLAREFSVDGRQLRFLTSTGQVLVDGLAHGGRGAGEPADPAATYECSELLDTAAHSKPWRAVARFPKEDTPALGSAVRTFRQLTPNVLVLAVAFISLWLLARTITTPLERTTAMLKHIAQGQGDLTKRLHINARNEIGQLAIWFNTFVTRVHTLVHSTSHAAAEVAAAASQVAASSDHLSRAMAEVDSQTSEAADDAENTGRVAEQGEQVVAQTIAGIHEMNRAVSQTSSTIEDLSQHSTQIHGIINTIHKLAQQTNLLALNATIEAARAGEAGRGFAVVADEVKELARQTTQATKDIEASLQAIHTKTDLAVQQMAGGAEHANSGVENARLTSASLERIVFGTRQFTKITGSISAITGQARAAVHQAATAAEQLARKAAQLNDQVGKFKLLPSTLTFLRQEGSSDLVATPVAHAPIGQTEQRESTG